MIDEFNLNISILGVAILRETNALSQLETALTQIKKAQLETKADHDKNLDKSKKTLEKEAQIKRNTLMPFDKSLLTLHKILTGKGISLYFNLSTSIRCFWGILQST